MYQRTHVVTTSVECFGVGLGQPRETFLWILFNGRLLIFNEVSALHRPQQDVMGLAQHDPAAFEGAQLHAFTLEIDDLKALTAIAVMFTDFELNEVHHALRKSQFVA
ncbi:hypothetical protein D9M71_785350 [compost metagenome]